MDLDMRTIVVMLLVSSVLMAVTLAVGVRRAHSAGLANWKIGLFLFALGWLLLATRQMLPKIIGVALGDALLLAGLCFQLGAIVEFGGRRVSTSLMLAPGAMLFALVLVIQHDYRTLTLGVSIAYAAALALIAVSAARLGLSAGSARWMLMAVYIAAAIMVLLRAADIWLNAELHPDMFATNFLETGAFVTLFATTVVGSVAFLLMHRERAESELHRLATFDVLTGLFNRRAFVEVAEREIARTRRTRTPYAVLMMDLDLFKRVNDDYGHQAGDRVLAEFAAIAKASVRTEDVLGRYGGEEFCAILPGATLERAIEIADRLRAAVGRNPLAGLPRATTVSIGATVCGVDCDTTLDAAIARADEALYRAKEAGRDRVVGIALDAQAQPGLEAPAGAI